MTAGPDALVVGPSDGASLLPDLDWLERELDARNGAPEATGAGALRPIRVVTLVNPGNPTGVTLPASLVRRAAEVTAKHG